MSTKTHHWFFLCHICFLSFFFFSLQCFVQFSSQLFFKATISFFLSTFLILIFFVHIFVFIRTFLLLSFNILCIVSLSAFNPDLYMYKYGIQYCIYVCCVFYFISRCAYYNVILYRFFGIFCFDFFFQADFIYHKSS